MEEYLIRKAVFFSKTYDNLMKAEIVGINIGNQKESVMKNIDNFINELISVCQNNDIDIDRLIAKLEFNKEMNQDVLMYIISGMEQNKKLR